MAGEHQIQITAIWQLDGAWTGEMAQCSWRLAYAPVNALPALGQQFTPTPANFSAAISETGEDTNYRWSRQWRAEYGGDTWGDTQELAAVAALKTYWQSVAMWCAPFCKQTAYKFALIKPDGRSAYGSNTYEFKTPIPGTIATAGPPEVAVATTLRAPVLGRRGRGRWYLPCVGMTTGSLENGKVKAALRTTLADAGKALVVALEGIGTGNVDFTPIVAVGSANIPTMYRPSQVRVGDHFDVQRRRQHQVTETYTTVSL